MQACIYYTASCGVNINVLTHGGKTYSVEEQIFTGTRTFEEIVQLVQERLQLVDKRVFVVTTRALVRPFTNQFGPCAVRVIASDDIIEQSKLFHDKLRRIISEFPNSQEAKDISALAAQRSPSNRCVLEERGIKVTATSDQSGERLIAHVKAGEHRVWAEYTLGDYHKTVNRLCGDIRAKLNI